MRALLSVFIGKGHSLALILEHDVLLKLLSLVFYFLLFLLQVSFKATGLVILGLRVKLSK